MAMMYLELNLTMGIQAPRKGAGVFCHAHCRPDMHYDGLILFRLHARGNTFNLHDELQMRISEGFGQRA